MNVHDQVTVQVHTSGSDLGFISCSGLRIMDRFNVRGHSYGGGSHSSPGCCFKFRFRKTVDIQVSSSG